MNKIRESQFIVAWNMRDKIDIDVLLQEKINHNLQSKIYTKTIKSQIYYELCKMNTSEK